MSLESVSYELAAAYTSAVSRIGDRIREVRKERRQKQYAVASKSGDPELTANYISKVESGLEENPGWKKLESIARGLDVDVSVITAQYGAPIPPKPKKGARQTEPDSTASARSGIVTAPTVSADGRSDSPLSADDLANRIAELCVLVVERSQRHDDRALFKRLAVGFTQAAGRTVDEREVG